MSLNSDRTNLVIKDGDYVIFKSDKSTFAVKVYGESHTNLWKQRIKLKPIIGDQFGFKYEIKKSQILRIKQDLSTHEVYDITAGKDNRNIQDDGKSQKLTKEEIEKLKAGGLSGEEIISNIVENSATFQSKTEFSQAKYLNKKRQKYGNIFSILKPTIRLVVEMYSLSNPLKILNLRMDSLSQVLTAGNILTGGKYLVFDSCLGLLTAAVVLRLGSDGNVVQLHTGDLPPRNIVQLMNFDEQQMKVLSSLPISRIYEKANESQDPPACKKARLQEPEDKHEREKSERRIRRRADWETSKSLLSDGQFDGLLIACKHDPNDCLEQLASFVALSRPVVIFSAFREPLVECFKTMRNSRSYVNMKLSDTWLRNYQVLPERSHPEINMSGSSGYILTAVKVEPFE